MDKLKEIIEGDKLIAEFMEVNKVLNSEGNIVYWYYSPEKGYLCSMLKYHSSWDWLMPVVSKINSLENLYLWEKHNIDRFNLTSALDKTDIESAYELCVEFIKWYNIPMKTTEINNKLQEQQQKFNFLLPDNMKVLGFDCTKEGTESGYYSYKNDGTKHYNKDYNNQFPEPRGKVIIDVNINYSGEAFTNLPFVHIGQDGDSRNVYNGVIATEDFLLMILISIR